MRFSQRNDLWVKEFSRSLALKSPTPRSLSCISTRGHESDSSRARERCRREGEEGARIHSQPLLRRHLSSRLALAVEVDVAVAVAGVERSGGGEGGFNFTTEKTYGWILGIFSFANAKGNMQRSFTILCTSLLGICLGSTAGFPSNINIGKKCAHAFSFKGFSVDLRATLASNTLKFWLFFAAVFR